MDCSQAQFVAVTVVTTWGNLSVSEAVQRCVISLVSVFHTPEMLSGLSQSWKHRTWEDRDDRSVALGEGSPCTICLAPSAPGEAPIAWARVKVQGLGGLGHGWGQL